MESMETNSRFGIDRDQGLPILVVSSEDYTQIAKTGQDGILKIGFVPSKNEKDSLVVIFQLQEVRAGFSLNYKIGLEFLMLFFETKSLLIMKEDGSEENLLEFNGTSHWKQQLHRAMWRSAENNYPVSPVKSSEGELIPVIKIPEEEYRSLKELHVAGDFYCVWTSTSTVEDDFWLIINLEFYSPSQKFLFAYSWENYPSLLIEGLALSKGKFGLWWKTEGIAFPDEIIWVDIGKYIYEVLEELEQYLISRHEQHMS